MLPKQIAPLAVLLFVLPAIGLLPASILAGTVVERLSIQASRSQVDVSGFDLGLAVGAGVLGVVAALLSAVGWLAANHHLHAAHAGRDPRLGSSLAVGLRRMPRAIGWGLVALVGFLLLVIAIGVLVALLVVVGESNAVFAVLVGLLAMVGLGVASVWLWVKLNFAGVAIAVAPRGTNPFGASWRFTAGRWWATFGRLLLLTVIVIGVSFVINLLTQAAAVPQLGSNLSVSPNGEDLLLDGVPIQDLDSIDLSDLAPGRRRVPGPRLLQPARPGHPAVREHLGADGALPPRRRPRRRVTSPHRGDGTEWPTAHGQSPRPGVATASLDP